MMNLKKAIRRIAKQEGISQKEVYREMEIAINVGYHNPDPAVQEVWKISGMAKPTVEEVINYCVSHVKDYKS